jgi:hypothetical protein
MISEYYDTVRDALTIELSREPTHSEIMEIVLNIINRHVQAGHHVNY